MEALSLDGASTNSKSIKRNTKMAKHVYRISVEYNSDPAYRPITVVVFRGSDEIADHSGSKLKPLLSKAVADIEKMEQEEMS